MGLWGRQSNKQIYSLGTVRMSESCSSKQVSGGEEKTDLGSFETAVTLGAVGLAIGGVFEKMTRGQDLNSVIAGFIGMAVVLIIFIIALAACTCETYDSN